MLNMFTKVSLDYGSFTKGSGWIFDDPYPNIKLNNKPKHILANHEITFW